MRIDCSSRRCFAPDLGYAILSPFSAATTIPEMISRNTELDQGETDALALAFEMHADAVLIDETAGRKAAIELGLIPVGVLGILVRAKRDGQLAAVAPVVDALLTHAQFRAAPELLREVLRMAGEAT